MKIELFHVNRALYILIWMYSILLPGGIQAQSNQKQIGTRTDSLKFSSLRPKVGGMNEDKARDLIHSALEFEQKQELRNALRAFFHALNFYEKENNQFQQAAILQEIGRLYDRWEVPERAIDYLQRALLKIKSHSLKTSSMGEIYSKLGESYAGLEKYDLAEKNFQDALEYNPNNIHFKRRILASLSEVYLNQKKLDMVLKTNLDLIEIEHKLGPSPNLSLALNNVGFIFKTMGDYDKALSFINQALETENQLKSKDMSGIISMRINLASALNQQKRYNTALTELFRSLKLAETDRNLIQQAEIRNFIALIYYNTEDYQNANFQCEEAVKISKRSGDHQSQLKTYRTYSIILSKLGAFEEAYRYLDKVNALKDTISHEDQKRIQNKLLKRINIERTEKELKILLTDAEKSEFELQNLSLEAERKQKDLELITNQKELQEITFKTLAFANEKALQISILQSQKLKNEKMMQEMALQQFESAISGQNLERRNRESKILLLEQEKNILEKSRKLQESKLQVQSTRERYFKAIGILIALVMVSVIYGFVQIRMKNQTLNRKQKEIENANLSLEQLNIDIQTKNQSITDSINYARGIQEAILPETRKWKSIFPESFIYYQPKDIVSGDFYFLTQYKKKWFVAFADCTGHGVPGALMSMIGHNLLTSIIEIHGITEPSQILKQIDEGIRTTLKTQSNESRDSMELGICIFDFENNVFEFSSSMRSLYGVRNGEMFEWKGDRHALGADSAIHKTFQTHSCSIEELDSIYLCSDGYQDQLGGPEIKRFMSNRLRQLLKGVAAKPMQVQGKLIEFTMKEWLADGRQLDDIMVIGIKPNGFVAEP